MIDTDVFSADLIPGSLLAARFRRLTLGRPTFISFQTAADIRFGAMLRGWGASRIGRMESRLAAAEIAPDARDVEIVDSPHVTFVDAGANFETVSCSVCGVNLDLDWWGEQPSVAWATRFEELDAVTPCCNSTSSLNDLGYQWPQGFARWYVTVQDPNRRPLDQSELDSLRSALGHELRIIWTHI